MGREKPSRPERQQGTSNDRVLWTMPNFLTVESADEIPQPNVSELGGAAAPAAISTYSYHVASERDPGKVVSVWAAPTAWDSVTYMLKEFWPDVRKRAKKCTGGLAAQALTAR